MAKSGCMDMGPERRSRKDLYQRTKGDISRQIHSSPQVRKEPRFSGSPPAALRHLTPFSRIRDVPGSSRSFREGARLALVGC